MAYCCLPVTLLPVQLTAAVVFSAGEIFQMGELNHPSGTFLHVPAFNLFLCAIDTNYGIQCWCVAIMVDIGQTAPHEGLVMWGE